MEGKSLARPCPIQQLHKSFRSGMRVPWGQTHSKKKMFSNEWEALHPATAAAPHQPAPLCITRVAMDSEFTEWMTVGIGGPEEDGGEEAKHKNPGKVTVFPRII